MTTPDQLQRTMPWGYEPPQTMRERIRLVAPLVPDGSAPVRSEVSDSHFSLAMSLSVSGREQVVDWRFQRRDDVVLPADLARFRDRVTKARKENDIVFQEPLADYERASAQEEESISKMARDPRLSSEDDVSDQILQAFAQRMRDDAILKDSGATSPIGRRVLVDRTLQDTLLGEDDAARTDLGRVVADALADPTAQYARGLVLFTSGHFGDAEQAFRASLDGTSPTVGPPRRWCGIAAYYDGRLEDAARSLREALQDESGDDRTITLVWLFLAAQRQDHGGEAAIAPYLSNDTDKDPPWAMQLLTAIRAIAQAYDKGTPPEGDFGNSPAMRPLVDSFKKEPKLQRQRGVQMMFFASQIVTKPADHAAAMQLLQAEAKSRSTSLPEDVCARKRAPAANRRPPLKVSWLVSSGANGGTKCATSQGTPEPIFIGVGAGEGVAAQATTAIAHTAAVSLPRGMMVLIPPNFLEAQLARTLAGINLLQSCRWRPSGRGRPRPLGRKANTGEWQKAPARISGNPARADGEQRRCGPPRRGLQTRQ